MEDAHRIAPHTVTARPLHRHLTVLMVSASVLAGCGVDVSQGSTGSSPVEPVEAPSISPTAGEHPGAVAPGAQSPTTAPTTAPTTTVVPTTVATTAAPGTVRVLSVVDGDTIDVERLGRIRLIGIDAPERGECGYAEATAVLAWMVRGREVVLVPGARDDADRYGRLLRYVEVGGVDVNLEMIRSGRAIARYDSRDGYGRHAREDLYVRADAVTPDANACAPSTTLAPPPPAGRSARSPDPRFRTCRDAIAAGFGPYRRGVDPEYDWYRDADGDGVACER